jgi:ParB family chromosome partitioning protein
MAGKGLGAGLGALLGDVLPEAGSEGEKTLPISKIEPRKGQPESIAEHGVIQPLTVRRIDGGFYQIIAGERRWRAARQAGLTEVPVRIIEADDRLSMELALVENLQREDLNPVEEARGYRTLMEEYGLTQEETAKRVGKSRPVVANALRLLTLPKKALQLTESGKLSLSQARAILEIRDDALRDKAAAAAAENGLTVREIEALLKKWTKSAKVKSQSRAAADGVDYYAEVENELGKALGRRVRIVSGRKKGRIELDYYDKEDFEQLCEKLRSLLKKDGGKTE